MFFRLFISITLACQVMLFAPGCKQFKDYRKKVYYEKGLELYEAQKYSEAIDHVDLALGFDPDYLDALELKGKCYYDGKNFMEAGKNFRFAFFLDESRDDLLYLTAESFFRAEKIPFSQTYTHQLLAKDPGNNQARYLDVRARLRSRLLRLWAEADTVLQPLLDDEEYQEVAFALLAEFHLLNDNLEMADLILMEHVDGNDDWVFVMRMLAEKYVSLNDQQAAVRIYKKILEVKPDSTQDIESLLVILRSSDRKEEERQLLDSLIAADGQQVYYKLKLIDSYIHYGQLNEAEEYARAGIEQETESFDFSQRLIEIYEKENRLPEAIQLVKHVLGELEQEEEKLDIKVHLMNMLARLYYLSNNLDMAKFVVNWILGIESGNEQARFMLARISLAEGRTLLAIAELRSISSEGANKPEYDYYMGLAHLARNESKNAEQSFKDALKKDPLYKPALLKMLEIYLESEFFSDVEHMIDDFLVANPNDPDVLYFQAQLAGKLIVVPEDG